jgi:glycosyltransferase involved in cell wall biosynthesis
MKVAIEASALDSGRGGDETYLRSFLAGLALVSRAGEHEFVVYLRAAAQVPREIAGDPRFSIRRLARLPSPIRYAIDLPMRVASERPGVDLLLTTNHAPPISTAPRVLLVHDLSFRHHPEHYSLTTRLRLNGLVPLHIRQARLVLTVSEFSRQDLMTTFGLAPERVVVVPPAVHTNGVLGARPDGAASLGARGVGDRFFLYLGNLHPRKNIARLVDAYARARCRSDAVAAHQLVIAGAPGWHSEEVARAAAALPGLVVMLGRIDDTERDALLRRATALVYPSLFEGFGLPPLEAMTAGTPVLASATTAMPEVLGDAALLVEPRDVEAIADGLRRLAEDQNLCDMLRERGRSRAAHYTVRTTGERALAAFAIAAARGERKLATSAS